MTTSGKTSVMLKQMERNQIYNQEKRLETIEYILKTKIDACDAKNELNECMKSLNDVNFWHCPENSELKKQQIEDFEKKRKETVEQMNLMVSELNKIIHDVK